MELIKIAQDHYVIVDGSEIKEGDLVFNEYQRQIKKFHAGSGIGLCRKITHSTQPLEWFGGEIIFLSEVKELIGEVDVEKKAYRFRRDYQDSFEGMNECIMNDAIHRQEGFIEGYNQALEDNKDRKYTEEDMKVAITQAFLSGVERLEDFERVQEMILDNIKPKTEWDIEFVDGKLTLKK